MLQAVSRARQAQNNFIFAGVAELADAPDLGSGVNDVGVQVPSPAPKTKGTIKVPFVFGPSLVT